MLISSKMRDESSKRKDRWVEPAPFKRSAIQNIMGIISNTRIIGAFFRRAATTPIFPL